MDALVYALAAEELDRWLRSPKSRRWRTLAKYARYRNSWKGLLRTRRYNTSGLHLLACRRWRLSHVRGPESYQNHNGAWINLMKVDPAMREEAMAATRTYFAAGARS